MSPEDPAEMNVLLGRPDRLDRRLAKLTELLIAQRAVRGWYTTAEAAETLGKAEFTVREYCRLGRLRAEKRGSGRGRHCAWVVPHAKLERYRREGLLPIGGRTRS